VHRTDGDYPVAWAKMHGKGRVFYATLGHAPESWDNPQIQKMYFEALKWAMGLSEGGAKPLAGKGCAPSSKLSGRQSPSLSEFWPKPPTRRSSRCRSATSCTSRRG